MRLKSSSELTSLSRRKELRCTTSWRLALARRQWLFEILKPFLDGPEHEREWRAKFVADVAEEGCLRFVQRGERFGALSLGLERASVADRRYDLRTGELEKAAIVLVERAVRARPATTKP